MNLSALSMHLKQSLGLGTPEDLRALIEYLQNFDLRVRTLGIFPAPPADSETQAIYRLIRELYDLSREIPESDGPPLRFMQQVSSARQEYLRNKHTQARHSPRANKVAAGVAGASVFAAIASLAGAAPDVPTIEVPIPGWLRELTNGEESSSLADDGPDQRARSASTPSASSVSDNGAPVEPGIASVEEAGPETGLQHQSEATIATILDLPSSTSGFATPPVVIFRQTPGTPPAETPSGHEGEPERPSVHTEEPAAQVPVTPPTTPGISHGPGNENGHGNATGKPAEHPGQGAEHGNAGGNQPLPPSAQADDVFANGPSGQGAPGLPDNASDRAEDATVGDKPGSDNGASTPANAAAAVGMENSAGKGKPQDA